MSEFGKKFAKKNVTRWNSILFMCRSVLKLTPSDYREIRSKLPKNSTKQKETRNNFDLSGIHRAMLTELVILLERFEIATNDLQTNHVSISRVYPTKK